LRILLRTDGCSAHLVAELSDGYSIWLYESVGISTVRSVDW